MSTFSKAHICYVLLYTLFINGLLALPAVAQKTISLRSPNGKIVFTFRLNHKTAAYRVVLNGTTIVAFSTIDLQFSDGVFKNNLAVGKPIFLDTTESYDLIIGKTSHVQTHYRSVIIPLHAQNNKHQRINFEVKVFDDGVAFRYVFPKEATQDQFELLEENTSFKLAGNPLVRTLQLPNYTSSHEGLYTTQPFRDLKEDTLMDMPMLLQFPHAFLAITEANLLDYAGMYLMKQKGVLVSKLSPLPGQSTVKVKGMLPHYSPWRVLLLSDRMGALLESNILTTLCAPPKTTAWTWLNPGKTTFPWWNGNVVPDTLNAPGNNFVTAQYYIDFCARNNIKYHTVVEYGLHQWYTDDGVGFQPGPHADVTTPVPGLDMKEICDYAATKGVGVRVWVHFYALYPKLDTAFAVFEKWGLKGLMVDFMDRDDQQMVNMQTETLEKAAQHHLHIQFHGAYKPTGLSRTYPNELTREGTRNYETNKWGPEGLSPDHDLNIAFTRGLAGSTDYHLGGFRAVPEKNWKAQYTRPLMLGTRCHMLAMYVVLENELPMVADYPAAYEGQPGFEFIKALPSTWDETKVLEAKPDAYIIVARRKGSDWFIGAITNHEARTLSLPLHFLPEGTYEATLFTDAANSNNDPNALQKQTRGLNSSDVLTLQLSAGGGAAVQLKKQ